MILLAIDTSTRFAGLAVADEDNILAEEAWHSPQNHGVELLPLAAGLLERLDLCLRDLSHLGVALGPGGFSALRVGISTAKGLSLPRGLPVAGISTFDIEASPYFSVDAPLYALLPAGRGEVAWARYDPDTAEHRSRGSGGRDTPEGLLTHADSGAVFCGEGATLLKGMVPAESLLSGDPPTRRPGVLARLACGRFGRGETEDIATLEPVYARAPSISTPREPHP